ncbi:MULTISPECIES: hypothetical protein [Enterobacter]|uniref:hypothetical protein n=1 Tax=Enterobacter TaxID=547 RepID=UPI0028EE4B82|nr:hypothetical protein [Enterobacter cloacae]WNT37811.1 hypothetical protein RRL13_06795 [Enterobacter cloacae]HDR2795470.1 hypothetical protein [Enterobacter asburiae]HDR2800851.1 hypothetical protein [Enterobacter asburiae]
MNLVNIFVRDYFFAYGLKFFLESKIQHCTLIDFITLDGDLTCDTHRKQMYIICFDNFELLRSEICRLKAKSIVVVVIDTPIVNDFFIYCGVIIISKFASLDIFYEAISRPCRESIQLRHKKNRLGLKLLSTCELLNTRMNITEIADIHNVSIKTIHSQKYQFMNLLGLSRRNILQCVKYASLLVNLKD